MTSRKRVLFLITKATFGGAQRYVYDLATNLPQHEYETGVAFGTRGRLADLLDTKAIPTLELSSLQRNIALISDLRSYVQIRDAIRSSRPHILHVNSSKAAALGALAGRLNKVSRIVFTVHGWPFKENRNIFSLAVIFIVSWITALLSHRVIVLSTTDERIARTMPGIAKKIRRIPLGREQVNVAPPQEGYKDMFGMITPPAITPKTMRLVSISELTANKGIRYAIEAVAELVRRGHDCVYVVVGSGEELPALKKIVRDRGLDDRVFFPGFIPDAARYMSGFDVYVLPSIKEGMPYVLIEASLAGLPIVATDVIDRDFAERLTHTKLVAPRNIIALADAIEEQAKRGRNAHPDNRFPLPDMITATLEAYED